MPKVGKVYVNRTLNMKRINYIGLDMDHTLIRYHTEKFEALAHRCMITKLLENLSYPKSIEKLKFDFDLAIRGLVIDKGRGNLLKLSRHAAIRESFHGLNRINYKDQRRLYKSTYIDLADSNFAPIDTTFSLSFANLFAQLVDLKDTTEVNTLPDYETIAEDLTFVLDEAHKDGSIKDVVRDNLDDYIIKDPDLVEGIENFIKHDKKIFIITNSDYFYTKLLLDYAINPFLKNHSSWMDLFEFTITLAQKPRFFYDKLMFLKVNPKDGTMTNAYEVNKGEIFQGGDAQKLTSKLGISPEEILYIGDHIYGDIVRLKKDCAWRTALVVEEIEQEIESIIKSKPLSDQIEVLMEEKIPLENKIDKLISDQIINGHKNFDKEISSLIEEVTAIDKKVSPLIREVRSSFNPSWGEVFRTGIEESYFAYQVDRFACIYMSKLTDLLKTSPRTYFRSAKKHLSHEI